MQDYPLIVSEGCELLGSIEGCVRYGMKFAQHRRATDFFLAHHDGAGVRVSVKMIDLAERLEIGVICIEPMQLTYAPDSWFDLPEMFSKTLDMCRLVMSTDFGSVDSGLVLTASDRSELILVSGAYPYTIEAKAPFITRDFEPEYALNNYRREPMP